MTIQQRVETFLPVGCISFIVVRALFQFHVALQNVSCEIDVSWVGGFTLNCLQVFWVENLWITYHCDCICLSYMFAQRCGVPKIRLGGGRHPNNLRKYAFTREGNSKLRKLCRQKFHLKELFTVYSYLISFLKQ